MLKGCEKVSKAHELAPEHLKTVQKRQKPYHNAQGTGERFSVGDRVWLFNSATKEGESRKLMSPWVGLFVILDKISDVNYKIGLENGLGRKQIVHYNRLKLLRHRTMTKEMMVNQNMYKNRFTMRIPVITSHMLNNLDPYGSGVK